MCRQVREPSVLCMRAKAKAAFSFLPLSSVHCQSCCFPLGNNFEAAVEVENGCNIKCSNSVLKDALYQMH